MEETNASIDNSKRTQLLLRHTCSDIAIGRQQYYIIHHTQPTKTPWHTLIEKNTIDNFIADRYSSYNTGIGAKIRSGETTLEELAAYAEEMGAPALPGSGRQEYLESVVNNILFCS